MHRRAAFDALISSQLHAGTTIRLLFRLRRAHPELAFEIDQISEALKRAADEIAIFDDDVLSPERDAIERSVTARP